MINKEKEKKAFFCGGEILDVIYFYVNITENLNRHKQSAPPPPPHTQKHTTAERGVHWPDTSQWWCRQTPPQHHQLPLPPPPPHKSIHQQREVWTDQTHLSDGVVKHPPSIISSLSHQLDFPGAGRQSQIFRLQLHHLLGDLQVHRLALLPSVHTHNHTDVSGSDHGYSW